MSLRGEFFPPADLDKTDSPLPLWDACPSHFRERVADVDLAAKVVVLLFVTLHGNRAHTLQQALVAIQLQRWRPI
jgi:hypothetical protein